MSTQFTGFSAVSLVGSGGLGTVYRAVRISTGGTVAIKELRDVGIGSPSWTRAQRELDALLRLKGHPFVVSVEEIFTGPNGPCLVMEYAPGGSLEEWVTKHGPLRPSELALVGLHASHALAAAHEVGVVHRDVKPHNLLLSSFGQVKVCDFGIASLTRGNDWRTRTSALTPSYASPEELDGDDDIGPATDVYSLGATLLHLASGRRPTFRTRDEESIRRSLAEVARDPALAWLPDTIVECMSLDAGQRPSMTVVADAFELANADLGRRRLARLGKTGPESELAAQLQLPPSVPPTLSDSDARRTNAGPTDLRPPDFTQPRGRGAHLELGDPHSSMDHPVPSQLAPPAPAGVGPRRGAAPIAAALLVTAAMVATFMLLRDGSVSDGPSDSLTESTVAEPSSPGSEPCARNCVSTTGSSSPSESATAGSPEFVMGPLIEHPGPVNFAAFSADGSRIATAGKDGRVLLFDSVTGTQLTEYPGSGFQIMDLDFAPAGGRIAMEDASGAITVWNTDTGEIDWNRKGDGFYAHAVGFDNTGSRLAIAGDDLLVEMWDIDSDRLIFDIERPPGSPDTLYVTDLALNLNGPLLGTITADGGSTEGISVVQFWNAETGDLLRTLDSPPRYAHSLDFSPGGTRVSLDADYGPTVWLTADGSRVVLAEGHAGVATDVEFDSTGSRIVTASTDGTAILWNADTGTSTLSLTGHTGLVNSASFSPDGSRVLTASDDGTAVVWDAASGAAQLTLAGHRGWVRSVGFTPDGSLLATTGDHGGVLFWGSDDGRRVARLGGSLSTGHQASLGKKGERVAVAETSMTDERTVTVWDLASGDSGLVLEPAGTSVGAVLLDDATDRVFTADEGGDILVWSAVSGELLDAFHGHTAAVRTMELDASSGWLLSVSADGTARVWAADGTLVTSVRVGDFASAAWLPSGREFALLDSQLEIRDATSGNVVRKFEGQTDFSYNSAAVSVSSDYIASVDATGLRVVDANDGHLVFEYTPDTGFLEDVSFSSDGRLLAVGGTEGGLIFKRFP